MFKFNSINGVKETMPKVVVWTCQSEYESAKKLGYPTFTNLPHNLEYYNENGIIVIRWGIGGDWYYGTDHTRGEFLNTFNTSKAICLNVEKRDALKKLSEVVLTPKIYDKSVPSGKLVVHRPTNHTGGQGFNVVKGPFNVNFGNYATAYIPNKKEWRVWFCNGKTMAAVRTTRSKSRLEQKYPAKSLWCYDFKKRVPKKLLSDTLKAAKQIGLVFGAADVIEYKKKFYFLELNTSPTVDSQEIEKFYKSGLNNLIKKCKIRKETRKVEQLPKPTFTFDVKRKMTNISYNIPTPNPKKSWIETIIGKYILKTSI